ncbi:heme exporter protein CcmD [Devosia sp.]|uniref:heme exporter protein CcmD n=1 Tax=Devosia sp. TaxID=1871048 RepID=UPI00326764B5
MIDLGPHAVFIIWAYIGVAIAVAGLLATTVLDARRIEARLRALDAQGIRRRSADPA